MNKIKEVVSTNKIAKYSLIIVALIIVLLSSTLAFYSWSSENNTNVSFTVASGSVDIVFNGGPDIRASLLPVDNKNKGIVKEITVKVLKNNPRASINLYLDINTLPNELK